MKELNFFELQNINGGLDESTKFFLKIMATLNKGMAENMENNNYWWRSFAH